MRLSGGLAKALQNKEVKKDNMLTSFIKQKVSSAINNQMLKNAGMSKSRAGASDAVYSPSVLNKYDMAVWGFNSPHLWRIHQDEIQQLFTDCLGKNHCEVAVGTGLFLKNHVLKNSTSMLKEITLLDSNKNTMDIAKRRLSDAASDVQKDIKYDSFIVDVTKSGAVPTEIKNSFDSVAANFLLHCLHGDGLLDETKYNAFKNCADLVKKDGIFFGSTILGHELLNNVDIAGPAAVNCINLYNDIGIFGNKKDSMEDLNNALNQLFEEVDVWQSGYCGVFKVKGPKEFK